ncbi:MAG: signal peptidase II [Phycisphaeraceae bacterium]
MPRDSAPTSIQPQSCDGTAAPSAIPRPAGRHGAAWAIFALTTLLVLAADLGFKAWSFAHVAGEPIVLTPLTAEDPHAFWDEHPHPPMVVVPHILSLRLTTNTGAVFGMFKGGQLFFVAVSILATAVIVRVFWTSLAGAWTSHLALGLILAGALGNLYDRVRFNAVRDMLLLFPGVHLPWGLNWPGGNREVYPWIFNLADAALLIGVVIMFLVLWRGRKPQAPAAARSAAQHP